MDRNIEYTLRRCTKPQLSFLLKLTEHPHGVGYTEGGMRGGAITTSLLRKKMIEPFGKVDGKMRWHLAIELSDEHVTLIRKMVSLL